MLTLLLVNIFAYLCGSTLFGPIFAKFFKLGDLRTKGSGNIGATNIARISGNKWIGSLTALCDCLKGIVPIVIAKHLDIDNISLIGALVVIGHIFPIWNQFKGGKGIATFIGINLAINIKIGFFMCIIWLIVFCFKKISSLASIIMVISCIIAHLILSHFIDIWLIIATAILIIMKHKHNIVGLLHGSERALRI